MAALATNKAQAAKTDTAVRVRRVQAADIPHVIGLDTRVTKLAKAEYWNDVFVRYGKRRLHERFFLVAESRVDKADPHVLGFIIGEIRAWEFGSTPCGWAFAVSDLNGGCTSVSSWLPRAAWTKRIRTCSDLSSARFAPGNSARRPAAGSSRCPI